MFRSKRQQEILESTESKLAKMFEEMNTEKRPDNGRTVCETECTMARIRSFSDFMYLMKVRPLQTACYYAAAVLFLLMLAALVPGVASGRGIRGAFPCLRNASA